MNRRPNGAWPSALLMTVVMVACRAGSESTADPITIVKNAPALVAQPAFFDHWVGPQPAGAVPGFPDDGTQFS
jgi:hypothetical protein